MKTNLLKLTILFILFSFSCSSDDDKGSVTKATIEIKNTSNQPVSNITVYAYTQETWMVIGDDPFFADGQATSDNQGKAIFSNLEYPTAFNAINNNQNNFRFSAYYVLNNVNKTKMISINFNKGDNKTGTIILD